MRVYIFMTVFSVVFILLNLYISKRFIAKLHINEKLKKYLNIFLVINFFGILGYVFTRYNPDMPELLYFLFSIPIGVVFLLFCTAVVYDIARLFITKVPIEPKRRDFFKKSFDYGALGVGFLLSARALYEARHLVIEDVQIKINNLAKPYSIVQLSDIHIGGLINEAYIAQMVEKVNALKPDLVVITGDLIDIKIENAKGALNELTKLNSTYGTYFIVGNHEYFHGIQEIIDTVNGLGIKVLENENLYIGEKDKGFNLAGVYDWFGYRADTFKPDINKALQNKDDNSPTILLAHQPRYIAEVKSGVDLMLSGHTHGGQLYPFRALVKLVQPYISGLHQHNDELQIYINRGSGFWGPPMRLGSMAEITKITIS